MSRIFFTSDTHFGHASIIRFCNRPFTGPDEMDEVLVENWNRTVGANDVVYHLGDFTMGTENSARTYVRRLNGQIHLIVGNHDQKTVRDCSDCFRSVDEHREISIQDQKIVLFHYPMIEWHQAWRGSWHLYGHVHGRLDAHNQSKCLDIGVDSHNYRPVSFDELSVLMAERPEYADWVNQSAA